MGDGRLQDGDKPEAVRRQDGGGRRDALPGSEARRGNQTPHPEGVPQAHEEVREIVSADGKRKLRVTETSGIAAAENQDSD